MHFQHFFTLHLSARRGPQCKFNKFAEREHKRDILEGEYRFISVCRA